MNFQQALDEVLQRNLSQEPIVRLLGAEGKESAALRRLADEEREKAVGKSTCVHAVLEFSNFCRNDCLYCGIRRSSQVKRYRMPKEEIVQHAVWAVKELGYRMIVLQSGEDLSYDAETLCDIAREILRQCRAILFFSIGQRDFSLYESLKKAGAAGVLYRFETSDRALFERLRPATSLDARLEHLSFLKRMRYLIATGFMIGLPGQDMPALARDILALGKIAPEMISVGPFIPSPLTPLSKHKPCGMTLSLNTIAVLRLIHTRSRIPVTTAFETLYPQGRREALLSGSNSLMVNITPRQYSASYAIYPGRFGSEEEIEKLTREAVEFVKSMGRSVCRGYARDLRPNLSAPACA
ncbi:MAG: radical SAM protein [Candidatus Micrarchaeota archaeon]|nr:radical SAM protein [Candidatus Micrarchaeota archaeon]